MRGIFVVLITAIWVVASALPALAERVALVIGNADYARSNPLENPVNDAVDMAARLAEIGYRLHGGGPHLNLTEREMSSVVRDYANGLSEGDLALFYFAGHGASYKGDAYLIPVDDGEIEYANDLRDFAYSAETVLERLRGIPDVTAVMILDACRNLPLPERPTGNRDTGEAQTGLARMEIPPGASAILMYAAAPDQPSSDGDGRNGTFTAALLRALDDPGRRIDDIHYEAAAAVRQETDGYQRPWIELGFAGTTPPLFSEPTEIRIDPMAQVARRTWATIRTIEDPATAIAAVESFLETFGDLPIAAEAEAELTLLRRVAATTAVTAPSDPGAKPGRGVLALAPAQFGALTLAAPPGPDGLHFDLLAGGFERADSVASSCRGFIASHPDYEMDWATDLGLLNLSADAAVQLSLVIRAPDGDWLCAAARQSLPPQVDLIAPEPGTYRIWVGTLDQQDMAPTARLSIRSLPPDTGWGETDRGGGPAADEFGLPPLP